MRLSRRVPAPQIIGQHIMRPHGTLGIRDLIRLLRLDNQAGRGQADIRLDNVLRAVRRRHRGRFLAKVRLAFAVTAVTAV